MDIDKIIENLGGIVPLYPKKQTCPNEDYWAKVEKLVGEQIPSAYKHLLLNMEYQHLITY